MFWIGKTISIDLAESIKDWLYFLLFVLNFDKGGLTMGVPLMGEPTVGGLLMGGLLMRGILIGVGEPFTLAPWCYLEDTILLIMFIECCLELKKSEYYY